MQLEICANSYQSAINAVKGGAHRIELCSELALGGITPSYGLIKKVVETLQIPVYVLIRPRSGDFTYSETEFDIMIENILLCKQLGSSGIVSGILHSNNTIDFERTKTLIEISKPLNFTFHRAFDWVINPKESIPLLEKIGVHNILSSGQKTSAEKGIDNLIQWKNSSKKITIIPGGGINASNIQLFQKNGFSEVHCSATELTKTIETPIISMNSQRHFNETIIATSSIEKIQNCIKEIEKKAGQ